MRLNWIEGVPRTRVEMRHELRFFKFDPGFHPLDIGNLHDIVEHTWSAEYGPQVSNADHRYAIEVSKFMNFVDMHGKPIPTKILYFIFDRTVANPNNPIFFIDNSFASVEAAQRAAEECFEKIIGIPA